MVEFWFGFGIICFIAMIMIGIGIWQFRSDKPVGFYSGENPPKKEELRDVFQWNKKHGMLWISYGIAIIGGYLLSAVIEHEIFSAILLIGVIVGGIPVMMWYHEYLSRTLLLNKCAKKK